MKEQICWLITRTTAFIVKRRMITKKENVVIILLFIVITLVSFFSGYYLGDRNSWAGVSGFYNPVFDVVKLKVGNQSPDELMFTCLHEAGHQYWFKYLDKEGRKYYERIYNNATEYVSNYASTNVEEDFAETYARIFVWVPVLEGLPKDRAEFFNKISEE